jgi:hypothetical protein
MNNNSSPGESLHGSSHGSLRRSMIRHDNMGAVPSHGHDDDAVNIDSLTYDLEDSDAWRAHLSLDHYHHRGKFWNQGKHQTMVRYLLIAMVGITQAFVAYLCNVFSIYFIQVCNHNG